MCGVLGVFRIGETAGPFPGRETLELMTDAMAHRGPDDRGLVRGHGYAVGARRLSIVDVEGGHQPVTNETGTVVAALNGELYNHLEVRRELERAGHMIRSRCDTEILPHLYEEIGPALPEKLDGMFGLVVWDSDQRRGLVARDRLGIKPVYYAIVDDLVIAASELKALLVSGIVPLDLDYDAIDAYLTLGFVPGPLTPLRHVRKLLPGHRLVLEPGGVHIERYWSYPSEAPVDDGWSDGEWRERLLSQLDDAVAKRLMADVPLGAMLSGGLDSSFVVALMAGRTSGAVKTFSVGFAGAPDNELEAARGVARTYATDHHELELSLSDPIDLEALVWSLDEPLADLSTIGFEALCGLAANDVKVALTGQGADELLAGYGRYSQVVAMARAQRVPRPVRRGLLGLTRGSSSRYVRALGLTLEEDPVAAAIWARTAWNRDFAIAAARGPLTGRHGGAVDARIAAALPASGLDPLQRTLALDGQLGLVDDMLHYFDRTSMAHALEVRVPFLDHRLVELAARIPTRLKMRRGTGKILLRQAARGLVPDEVIDRPKVGFFSSAVDHWFEAQLPGLIGDVLLDPGARYSELLDPEIAVRSLLGGPRDYRHSKFLLSVLMLELWLSTYLPRARSAQLAAARL